MRETTSPLNKAKTVVVIAHLTGLTCLVTGCMQDGNGGCRGSSHAYDGYYDRGSDSYFFGDGCGRDTHYYSQRGALTKTRAILTTHGHATESSGAEKAFPSSDLAIAALRAAVAANDHAALNKLFGPTFQEIMTGDKVQDANNLRKFAVDLAQRCHPVEMGGDKITLEIGSNDWPMPIPLVRADNQWHFETAEGKEEIVTRHIGKDELTAIGVCRAYVGAQRLYAGDLLGLTFAGTDVETSIPIVGMSYAQHFVSSPGKKDGLYWPATNNEPTSPFGPLVAEAQDEGYVIHKNGTGPHPFHGYYFKILTRQGAAAPGGKMSYIRRGIMTKGFALVAYPEHWNRSGVMTFIVNQEGKVLQKDFGERTSLIAGVMKDYNPDTGWSVVGDEGIWWSVSER